MNAINQMFVNSIFGKTTHPGFSVVAIYENDYKREVGTYTTKEIAMDVLKDCVTAIDGYVMDMLTGEIFLLEDE